VPQTVESLFILHRVTRDPKWRERGWQIFEALEKRARIELGYASVIDVTLLKDPLDNETVYLKNEMPSWFLAETSVPLISPLHDDADRFLKAQILLSFILRRRRPSACRQRSDSFGSVGLQYRSASFTGFRVGELGAESF
jgi:hypothetical protein